MKLRRTLFLLSILLHLLGIYWLARVQVPLLIPAEVERVIRVVPISLPSFPLGRPTPAPAGKAGGPPVVSSSVRGSIAGTGVSTDVPANDQPQGEGIIEKPPLIAQPADVKKIPDLNIYSDYMQGLLKNFDRGKTSRSRSRTGTDAGSRGGRGAGEIEIPAGENRVFFDIDNYDLTSWGRQVLLRIQRNWIIPMITKEKVEQPAEIVTVIEKSGKISSIKVTITSNSEAFDQAAMNAILLSSPVASLPGDFPNENLEARFIFAFELP